MDASQPNKPAEDYDQPLAYPDQDEQPTHDSTLLKALKLLIIVAEQPGFRKYVDGDDWFIFDDIFNDIFGTENSFDHLSRYNDWLFNPTIEDKIGEWWSNSLIWNFSQELDQNVTILDEKFDMDYTIDYNIWYKEQQKVVRHRMNFGVHGSGGSDLHVRYSRQILSDDGEVLQTDSKFGTINYYDNDDEWVTDSNESDEADEEQETAEIYQDNEKMTSDIRTNMQGMELTEGVVYDADCEGDKNTLESFNASYEVYDSNDDMVKKYVHIHARHLTTALDSTDGTDTSLNLVLDSIDGTPTPLCSSTSTEIADAEVEEIFNQANTRRLKVVADTEVNVIPLYHNTIDFNITSSNAFPITNKAQTSDEHLTNFTQWEQGDNAHKNLRAGATMQKVDNLAMGSAFQPIKNAQVIANM